MVILYFPIRATVWIYVIKQLADFISANLIIFFVLLGLLPQTVTVHAVHTWKSYLEENLCLLTNREGQSVPWKWCVWRRVGLKVRLLGISVAIIPRAVRVLTLPFHTEKLPGSSRHRIRRKRKGMVWGEWELLKKHYQWFKIELRWTKPLRKKQRQTNKKL